MCVLREWIRVNYQECNCSVRQPLLDSRAQAVVYEYCSLGRCDAVRHKCSTIHTVRELNSTRGRANDASCHDS